MPRPIKGFCALLNPCVEYVYTLHNTDLLQFSASGLKCYFTTDFMLPWKINNNTCSKFKLVSILELISVMDKWYNKEDCRIDSKGCRSHKVTYSLFNLNLKLRLNILSSWLLCTTWDSRETYSVKIMWIDVVTTSVKFCLNHCASLSGE